MANPSRHQLLAIAFKVAIHELAKRDKSNPEDVAIEVIEIAETMATGADDEATRCIVGQVDEKIHQFLKLDKPIPSDLFLETIEAIIENRERVVMLITDPATVFHVAANLQLACRHPENVDGEIIMKPFVGIIKDALKSIHPAISTVIDNGWIQGNDITEDEFAQFIRENF
jgi:hypothetical protein